MDSLGLLIPVFFGAQFVVVLVGVISAMVFADPQLSIFGRNLR